MYKNSENFKTKKSFKKDLTVWKNFLTFVKQKTGSGCKDFTPRLTWKFFELK
jgi:hypothetical protein